MRNGMGITTIPSINITPTSINYKTMHLSASVLQLLNLARFGMYHYPKIIYLISYWAEDIVLILLWGKRELVGGADIESVENVVFSKPWYGKRVIRTITSMILMFFGRRWTIVVWGRWQAGSRTFEILICCIL